MTGQEQLLVAYLAALLSADLDRNYSMIHGAAVLADDGGTITNRLGVEAFGNSYTITIEQEQTDEG